MFNPVRHCKRAAVCLAALAAISAASAATSYASSDTIDADSVSLGSGSFTFGSGWVTWYHSDGKYSANLSGFLKLKDANGSCARMRTETFDNGESLTVNDGGVVCADDGGFHTFTVDLPIDADSRIDLLKVSIQSQTAASGWSTVESKYFEPDVSPVKVRLTADGVDFGDDWFVGSSTTGSDTLDWGQGDQATFMPRLRGYLHLNNMAGVCARMKLTYRDETQKVIDTETGGVVCAPDNHHYSWSVDLAPYHSSLIAEVDVAMQTQGTNGSWNTISTYGSSYGYTPFLTL